MLDFVASSDDFFDFLNDNGFILNPKKRSMNEIRKMIYYFLYSEVIQIKPQVQALIDQTKRQRLGRFLLDRCAGPHGTHAWRRGLERVSDEERSRCVREGGDESDAEGAEEAAEAGEVAFGDR